MIGRQGGEAIVEKEKTTAYPDLGGETRCSLRLKFTIPIELQWRCRFGSHQHINGIESHGLGISSKGISVDRKEIRERRKN